MDLPTHPTTTLDLPIGQCIRKVYRKLPRSGDIPTYLTRTSLVTVFEQCGLGGKSLTLLWIGIGDGRGGSRSPRS